MRFFAKTLFDQIRHQIETHIHQDKLGNKLLFMVPSMPAAAVEKVGAYLSDYCAERADTIPPLIKIANSLFTEWENSDDVDTRELSKQMAEKGWNDDRGNLTSYRNVTAVEGSFLIVLLIGIDRVTDSSSLADFHHCDLRTVWENELRGSFAKWTRMALEASTVGFEEDTVLHFDRILQPLIERGLADILQISALLESIDLAAAQDGSAAEEILLCNLGNFGLPLFSGYKFSSRRSFGPYIDDAVAFFSYDTYLEDRARQGALKKIERFIENQELGELFDQRDRGPYDSDQTFVDGLIRYIGTRNVEERDRLFCCDFVTIRDRILKYRPPRTPDEESDKPERVKKLTGGPIEVVLSGVWSTLAEFKKKAAEKGVFAHEVLREIRIESKLFKHDSNGSSADERTLRAQEYLLRLVGGVDRLIEQYIELPKLCEEVQDALVRCKLFRQDIVCQPARTAEPFLQFAVDIFGEDWTRPVSKQFAWRLPEIEPYRVTDELIQWAAKAINDTEGYCLPLFHVPYYEELMLAKDDEETRRILKQCVQDEGDSIFNLLSVKDLDTQDPLFEPVRRLAFEYDSFIQKARKEGLHAALMDTWDSLRKTYEQALDAYLYEPACVNSPIASLLFRSFLIVSRRHSAEGDRWVWDPFELSGVVTVLHPALLEMLQAHVIYIITCFMSVAGKELRAPGVRSFRDIVWQNYMDLAAIQMPLSGLIKDRNRILDTNVRGENLIHRIGDIGNKEASLTTRLLLRYDAFDDEDVSDAELFRKSRESILIYRILRDYRKLHPHADDGLSIAIYQNQDIQPVIAAIDQYLNEVCTERDAKFRKYAISVTVFTESSDDTSVARWISQWKERWEAAENQGSLTHYRQSFLSVSHRIVSSENYYRQFRQLIIKGLEVDIAILNGFIGAGSEGNDFETVEPYDVRSRTLKFPILEKPFCSLKAPGRQLQRARVLSNRQFRISARHAELMARLKSRATPQNTHHVVLGFGDYTPWQAVVDALHQRAEWVVCIDPNIDERLIAMKSIDTEEKREIIGFGSGVGSHGEANFTISTEQFRLSDILHRLRASIGEIYSGWESDDHEIVAKAVLGESFRLSGLSLVRATGIGHYIREYLAYALSRKLLVTDKDILCDQLVSLDAYRHWFDSADSDTRPDLLWLIARVGDDRRLQIDLRLIECKLAKMSDVHLDKAHQQLENGLNHLVSVFKPRLDKESVEDDRPDQRYWWLQLHRLIASKAEISQHDQEPVLTALERLAEGDFDIEWRAAAVTFWTDQATANLSLTDVWPYTFERQELGIGVVSTGSVFVRELCRSGDAVTIPWHESTIRFEGGDNRPITEEPDQDKFAEDGRDSEAAISEDREDQQKTAMAEAGIENIESEKTEKAVSTDPGKIIIPKRIFLGVTAQGLRKVYWEFGHRELNNRHILIFGTSGMGKTYTIQCLLFELGQYGQNSLIVDYSNGFFDNQIEEEFKSLLQPVQHVVRKKPLAINPFRQKIEIIAGSSMPEGPSNTAQRVSGVFAEVYNLGDQQKSALYQAVKSGVGSYGETADMLKDIGIESPNETAMTINDLIPRLEELIEEKGAIGTAASSLISKIRPFVDQNPFGREDPESWEKIYSDTHYRCHILQLTGFLRDASRLITEFSLIDLYWFYRGTGTKDRPRVIVLDEIQNLDQREESPLAQLLREGRKFGFSLILATQTMSNLEKDARDRLFNAGHKLFFRPAETEIKSYAEIAAMSSNEKPDAWIKKLASLKKAECYSIGPSLNEATGELEIKVFKIRITSLQERSGNG